MTEHEYDEALLREIRMRVSANIDELERFSGDPRQQAFFDGANTALEELAVQFGLVSDFGMMFKR